MQPFRKHTGVVVPLDKVNVDTDQIIPKQFLKRIERTGFGEFLFYDWRFSGNGKECGKKIGDFVLDAPRYAKASILVAGKTSAAGPRANMPSGRWRILAFGW
jgi:3-isopropylmalate/(R)-2-methylmalate dehydratase small subunit